METSICGGDDDSLAVSSRGSAADTETAEVGRCPSSSDSAHLAANKLLGTRRTGSSRRQSRHQLENDYETVDQNASFSPKTNARNPRTSYATGELIYSSYFLYGEEGLRPNNTPQEGYSSARNLF